MLKSLHTTVQTPSKCSGPRSAPSSGTATEAIREITEVIQQIGDYTTTIASAVEEQTATTAEMSRSVAE